MAQAISPDAAETAQHQIPFFIYRPANGLTIIAADEAWEVQFGNRMAVYWTFWTQGSDGTSRTKKGTANGVLQIRRFYPYMNARLNSGFYDLQFALEVGPRGEFVIRDALLLLHFEYLNPSLPYLVVGAGPGTILNPQDANCSTRRCGRSERSLLANGAGVGDGTVDRGLGFVWDRLPRLGFSRITFLNFLMGQARIGTPAQFDDLQSADISRDGRSLGAGIGIKPFDTLAGSAREWLAGLEVSFGTFIQETPDADRGFAPWDIQTNQTAAQPISMIRSIRAGTSGRFYYYTPGIGWDWDWVRLRLAGQFAQASVCIENTNGRCVDGPIIRGRGWRFMGEFWLWSPGKGLLSGNPRDGGFMLAPMFQRTDVTQGGPKNATLDGCAGCKRAHATNSGVALWYFIPGRFMNIGVVWDHWSCVNCNEDVARVVSGFIPGGAAAWDTITLITRFQF